MKEERNATSGVKTWTSRKEDAPGSIHSWSKQLDDGGRQPSQQADHGGDSSPIIDWNLSRVDEMTAIDKAVPIDMGFSSTEVPAGGKSVEPAPLTSPQTICHVRVTVRHRSPRRGRDGTTDSVQGVSGDATPVPALRRAGASSKRTPPAGRRVTFSKLPPVVDQRRPVFAAPRSQRNTVGQAALDTLWHYHEIYPSVDSRRTEQALRHIDVQRPDYQVPSPDDRLPETPRNENENENTKPPGDVITSGIERTTTPEHNGELASHRAPSSHNADEDDDGDDDNDNNRPSHQQQQQQGSRCDDVDELEEVSLSLKQLVASFESMTSPFMRAPVVAASRIQTE